MSAGQTLTVTAQDAYTNTYNYNQVVNGQDFNTYDAEGNVNHCNSASST